MPQKDTLDRAAYTCMLVSYRRLSPQFQFSLSGVTLVYLSQWYIRLCEGRESLSPNFKTVQDPMHQFHKIGILVSETLYLLATLALLHMQAELIPWKFCTP